MDESTLWQRWGELTRFMRSGKIAFDRETQLWQGLELDPEHGGKIKSIGKDSQYTVTVEQHVAVVSSITTLLESVLVVSYALAEAAAAARLGESSRQFGGIEDWGKRLLEVNHQEWSDVLDGKAGLAEVAAIRHLVAHSLPSFDDSTINRLRAAGCDKYEAGDRPELDFEMTIRFRDRLRSLLRVSGIRRDENGLS